MSDDRFRSWEERTQNLRTHSIGVFQGITLATLGFIISKILDPTFIFRNQCVSILLVIALSSLIIASIILLFLVLNRLQDFRTTTQIVRKKDTNDLNSIEELRAKTERLGKKTHRLLGAFVFFFSIGEICAITGFAIQICPKMFP